MVKSYILVLSLSVLLSSLQARIHSCKKGKVIRTDPSLFKPLTEEQFTGVPESLDWGWHSVDGVAPKKNYLSTMRNQHLPVYCGSCWAQAATSIMSDRLNILTDKSGPEMSVSPQMMVACTLGKPMDGYNGDTFDGCHGGDQISALKFAEENFMLSESCMPYRALNVAELCTPEKWCFDIHPDNSTVTAPQQNLNKFKTKNTTYIGMQFDMIDVGNNVTEAQAKLWLADNEKKIIQELQKGPVACGIYAYGVLDDFEGGKIFPKPSSQGEINHSISIVGYGVKDGKKFWKIRNSWGDFWADGGFFLLERGTGALSIETNCGTAEVVLERASPSPSPTFPDYKEVKQKQKVQKKQRLLQRATKVRFSPESNFLNYFQSITKSDDYNRKFKGGLKLPAGIPASLVVKSPLPQDYVSDADLPSTMDYTNYMGQNVLSWTVNQHLPQYCGSCYAQTALGILADRVNIQAVRAQRSGKIDRHIPIATLSVQQVLDCGIGSCEDGGSYFNVFKFFYESGGAVPFGCNIYTASSPRPSNRTCSAYQNCGTHPIRTKTETIKDYQKVEVLEYGFISGATNMKKEIMARGPISCGIQVTDNFESTYAGEIYSEKLWKVEINHGIAVVGWGIEDGVEYWTVRNSWGTMWGLSGYFRIKMYEDNLGIESSCGWAVPKANF